MLWGTSSLALYIPWAGTAGPYLGISLWLWLGVLDAVQGVGLGMILLQVFLTDVLLSSMEILRIGIDTIPPSCLRHPRFLPDHWLNLCHGCSRNCTESPWTWYGLPRCSEVGFLRRTGRLVDRSHSNVLNLMVILM